MAGPRTMHPGALQGAKEAGKGREEGPLDDYLKTMWEIEKPKFFFSLETPIFNYLINEPLYQYRDIWDPTMKSWLCGKPVGSI